MLLQTCAEEITELQPSRYVWFEDFCDRHFEKTGQTKEEVLEKLTELPRRMLEMAGVR